jgi:hypothetical protein
MAERRRHWKENLGVAARLRAEKRADLLLRKEEIAEQIRSVGLDFERYDELKAAQRRVIAELAALWI